MARYNENECAHCAEDLDLLHSLIGRDWKVYCSETCRTAGERASENELQEWRTRIPVQPRHAPRETQLPAWRYGAIEIGRPSSNFT